MQTSSLVGHRLSQHLSVSVGSEEGDEKSEDQKSGGGSMKPSSTRAPVRSREESSAMHDSAAVATGLKSEHEAMLRVSTADFLERPLLNSKSLSRLSAIHTLSFSLRQISIERGPELVIKTQGSGLHLTSTLSPSNYCRHVQELRKEHARDLDALEQAHSATKREILDMLNINYSGWLINCC